LRLKLLMR